MEQQALYDEVQPVLVGDRGSRSIILVGPCPCKYFQTHVGLKFVANTICSSSAMKAYPGGVSFVPCTGGLLSIDSRFAFGTQSEYSEAMSFRSVENILGSQFKRRSF